MIAGGNIKIMKMGYCGAMTDPDESVECVRFVKQKYGEVCGNVQDTSPCASRLDTLFQAQYDAFKSESPSESPNEAPQKFLEDCKKPAKSFLFEGSSKTQPEHLANFQTPTSGPDIPPPVPAPQPAPAAGGAPAPAPAGGGGTLAIPPDVYGDIDKKIKDPSTKASYPLAAVNLEKLRSACEGTKENAACKATFEGALGQLYLQSNGEPANIAEALNNYNAPRTFVNLKNSKGENVDVNSLDDLQKLLETGFGESASVTPSSLDPIPNIILSATTSVSTEAGIRPSNDPQIDGETPAADNLRGSPNVCGSMEIPFGAAEDNLSYMSGGAEFCVYSAQPRGNSVPQGEPNRAYYEAGASLLYNRRFSSGTLSIGPTLRFPLATSDEVLVGGRGMKKIGPNLNLDDDGKDIEGEYYLLPIAGLRIRGAYALSRSISVFLQADLRAGATLFEQNLEERKDLTDPATPIRRDRFSFDPHAELGAGFQVAF